MDLHSHLDLYPNPLELAHKVNERCEFTLLVTTSPKAWLATSKRMKIFNNIKVALGLHPEIAHLKYDELSLFLDNIKNTRFIGEIGLDGSPKYKDTFELQVQIFDKVMAECNLHGNKVISIHSRGAVKEVLNILLKYPKSGKPILHWYTGNLKDLQIAIKLGCRFSIGLQMLKTKKGIEIINNIPKELILLETDGPFVSLDNNFTYPWDTEKIIPYLSEVWGVNKDICCNQLRDNLNKLLKI
ncbi:Qat anti-phage system TatD family nuclease QatD [Acinetobacter seifertii]|uniref:Qat anti-phage system TatD family nuclease QatD n=1 Tax=Acinetobacter seifertii TaxID=1530123 RepID=UPI001F063F34|nr:Qat anti-phage system TatD family nuclease QatD [Acinetobacter seifertii]MCH2003253.1 TatD family hydrolase [Acinetobacter seifertii]